MPTQVELPAHENAEALLRSLELQTQALRAQRAGKSSNRAALLMGGLLIILGGTAFALFALFSRLREPGAPHAQPSSENSNP